MKYRTSNTKNAAKTPSSTSAKYILYIIFISLSVFSEAKEQSYDLLLAGGSLKTCSSMAAKNCQKNTHFDQAKHHTLYQISADSWQRFKNTSGFQALLPNQKQHLKAALMNNYSAKGADNLTREALFSALQQHGFGAEQLRELDDSSYYALLDTHEISQLDSQGDRVREQVSINATTNPHTRHIYQRFVQQAKLRSDGQPPTILVLTASSRDPFEVADFYLGVFEDLGAQTVWLPLSAAMQQALAYQRAGFGGCDQLASIRQSLDLFDRQRIYPQRTRNQHQLCKQVDELHALIEQADGLFINGGDQSKTLAALTTPDGQPSAELLLIRERVNQGHLIVGGTSAGTAVMPGGSYADLPIPMISNGDPRNAMRRGAFAVGAPSQRCAGASQCESPVSGSDLTYRALGGLGFFNYGLLDTHFSERDRETRLIVLAGTTQQHFGFGVDETTALLVKRQGSNATMEVIGQAGVFVADMRTSQWQQVNDIDGKSLAIAGLAHYWHAGTTIQLINNQFEVSLAGNALATPYSAQRFEEGQWREQIAKRCGSSQPIRWQRFGNQYITQASQETRFAITDDKFCSYQSLPFVLSYPAVQN